MRTIPCAICGGVQTSKVLTGHDRYLRVDRTSFTLVRCENCGLVYLNPQPTPAELAKYYPPSYPSYQEKYQVLGTNRLLEFLKRIKRMIFGDAATVDMVSATPAARDNSRLRVLDFGCGGGHFLLSLHEKHPSWELFGFDIATNQGIREIGHGISVTLGEPQRVQEYFAAQSFDRIYLNMVLEHVNDPAGTLTKLASLLKKDGEMIIEVPNIDSIKFKIFKNNHFPLEIPRHLYHFSPRTLSMLCEKCGLSIVDLKITGSSKGTARNLYYTLGLSQEKIDPLLFLIVDKLTRLIGEKHINDEGMVARAKKTVSLL